jgi:hypothetical protein
VEGVDRNGRAQGWRKNKWLGDAEAVERVGRNTRSCGVSHRRPRSWAHINMGCTGCSQGGVGNSSSGALQFGCEALDTVVHIAVLFEESRYFLDGVKDGGVVAAPDVVTYLGKTGVR